MGETVSAPAVTRNLFRGDNRGDEEGRCGRAAIRVQIRPGKAAALDLNAGKTKLCGLAKQENRPVTSFTIPDLDDEVRNRLRARAARNGRSMEDEARSLLHEAVAGEPDSKNLATIIRECFEPYGGAGLELPPREPAREPPMFD